MTDKERLIELLEQEKAFSRCMTDDERRERLADFLLENGVIVLPVPVDSPCRIRKVIVGRKKIKRIDFEDAVVTGVGLFTKSKSGAQIMSMQNVFPTGGNSDNG